VHEGGISTPLIVHWPAGLSAAGELRHHPGHLVDIVPTLLDVAGARKPTELGGYAVPPAPGRSLVASFSKDDPQLPGYLWWQHENHRAVRAGDWKLVALAKGEWELYDLSKDRGESNNLAQKHPERVKELEALWEVQAKENRRLALSDSDAKPQAADNAGK
jgi:arylsulfatase